MRRMFPIRPLVPAASIALRCRRGLTKGWHGTMNDHTKVIRLREVRPLPARSGGKPSKAQVAYLKRGLEQPGGKLPLFDLQGQRYSERTIRSCIDRGWAEPWFNNPLKPDWLVCKLTDAGRGLFEN